MNQDQFHRAVARATGESLGTIAHRGFVMLTRGPFEREPPGANYEDLLQALCIPSHPQARGRDAA